MTLPQNIRVWLNARGIADTVIDEHKLDWNGTQLVIPVLDIRGNFLFNKYRKDPLNWNDLPKYMYDAGSTSALFNIHKLGTKTSVIICEGELDALALESRGYLAVSSTGGAGSFKTAWLPHFIGKDIYVCYDNDEAGMKGAVKLLTKLPAKFVLVPRMRDVKDITEYLTIGNGNFPLILEKAESYPILSDPLPELKCVKDIEMQIKRYNGYMLGELREKERALSNRGLSTEHLQYIRKALLTAVGNLKQQIRRLRYNRTNSVHSSLGSYLITDLVAKAKEVPLTSIYNGELRHVGQTLVGLCPFHNERTPSFVIYPDQNKWYCFGGCAHGGDVIEFIRKKEQCDFGTAIKKLLNIT